MLMLEPDCLGGEFDLEEDCLVEDELGGLNDWIECS